MKKIPTSVDLFCGAGGLSQGLKLAGFDTLVAVDNDPNAIITYKRNHPKTNALCMDVTKLTGDSIRKIIGEDELDLVAGGPSCQGFSTHGKRDEDDPRNFLFKHFIRIARELNPRWILIENVRGLLTYRGGYFKDLICDSLKEIGYNVDAKILCAADFGVPQLRHRIFFIANRIGANISYPEATHGSPNDESLLRNLVKQWVTVEEAIGDLPLVLNDTLPKKKYKSAPKSDFQKYARDKETALTLHVGRPLSQQAQGIAKFVTEGHGLRQVPAEFLPARFQKMRRISNGNLRSDCTTLYFRLHRARPSYTITCNFRNVASGPFLHPIEDRSITPREAARLMSFQDTYEFSGTGIPRQIGNAVPPLLAKAVGSHIRSLDPLLKTTDKNNSSSLKI